VSITPNFLRGLVRERNCQPRPTRIHRAADFSPDARLHAFVIAERCFNNDASSDPVEEHVGVADVFREKVAAMIDLVVVPTPPDDGRPVGVGIKLADFRFETTRDV